MAKFNSIEFLMYVNPAAAATNCHYKGQTLVACHWLLIAMYILGHLMHGYSMDMSSLPDIVYLVKYFSISSIAYEISALLQIYLSVLRIPIILLLL